MEATAWYLEEGEIEVGLRFAEELDRTIDRIATNPLAWTEVKPGMRRALVHGFPYEWRQRVNRRPCGRIRPPETDGAICGRRSRSVSRRRPRCPSMVRDHLAP